MKVSGIPMVDGRWCCQNSIGGLVTAIEELL